MPPTTYEIHGSRFTSHVAPRTGSTQLCAWRLEVPAGSTGVAHTVSHEEVFLVLEGPLTITLDGEPRVVVPGDVVLVPAGASLRVDTDANAASMWVTTSVGLTATMPDGSSMVPPWTQ